MDGLLHLVQRGADGFITFWATLGNAVRIMLDKDKDKDITDIW